MLVDSAYFVGPAQIVADNVTALPAGTANALVYLTVQDGDNAPGLYIYLSGAWKLLSDSDPVT